MKILIGIGFIILLQILGLALCSANGKRKEEEEDWFKHEDEVEL